MNLYTEQQMRDAIKMARNGARSEDNIIDSLNFIKPYIELPSDDNNQSSIEWLQAIELERDLTLADWNKAKAMHKEECINLLNTHNDIFDSSEDHYNKTFNK